MAAALEVTVNKGSDAVYDYVCSVCEESNTLTEAKFNCERCYKFYCDGCVDLHNQLFKTHSVTGRENKNAWPVSKATKHIIEKCSAHKNEKLKMFCENHSELCCHLCILQGHRTCQSVVQIVEKSKEINTRGDVSLLIGEITRHIKDLDERTNTTEEMLKNLQDSYSREGVLQKKLYEDTSGGNAVFQCAVSPDGDTIYVTNYTHHKLLTLDKHGTLLASFSDPELQNSFGIYVTDAGHVIVSGYASHSILQISRDGKKKLATLLTHNDGMKNPTCVFVCKHNGSIIVGQDSDNILMFKCT
ncbi:hypothetical protein DPMN_125733 [Dreissena polymorpha]|uniref:B box-type domain-containing protein n=1 Tax=Dreissena polymorpha TaxID=45954 RepID=A0A9D4JXG9_DREPO|nr:hypothetical protein DPMN_125733 [Dreissena polymorpha]